MTEMKTSDEFKFAMKLAKEMRKRSVQMLSEHKPENRFILIAAHHIARVIYKTMLEEREKLHKLATERDVQPKHEDSDKPYTIAERTIALDNAVVAATIDGVVTYLGHLLYEVHKEDGHELQSKCVITGLNTDFDMLRQMLADAGTQRIYAEAVTTLCNGDEPLPFADVQHDSH